MQERVSGNAYRLTLVCVDRFQNDDFSGRLYNPYWENGRTFHSAVQFLLEMEALLDQMKLPQSFTAKRSFSEAPSGSLPVLADGRSPSGVLATFQVRVLFRQNASWQGALTWVEGRREESFRSVLELLLLLHSALEAEKTV